MSTPTSYAAVQVAAGIGWSDADRLPYQEVEAAMAAIDEAVAGEAATGTGVREDSGPAAAAFSSSSSGPTPKSMPTPAEEAGLQLPSRGMP